MTGALREWLGNKDPQTADANANYHLYRTAADVLAATEESERSRPKVGRQIMARALGGAVGEGAAGLPGFAVGAVLGPAVDSALTSGPTLRIGLARALNDFAKGTRSGSEAQMTSAMARIRALTVRGAALQGAAQQVSQQPAVADRVPQ